MEAKELRIGNIIEWNKTPFNVCVIHPDKIENELWCKSLNEIHPIPLTEEWLVKLGFISDSLGGFNSPRSMNIYFLDKHINICYAKYAESGVKLEHIKYVHQLQNLYFALTGEELTIK